MKPFSSGNYSSWSIRTDERVKGASLEDKIRHILGYGVLAPSVHNSQPWKIKINASKVLITVDHTRKLAVADPEGRGMFIAIGAFVENIVQAAPLVGMKAYVSYEEDYVVVKFADSQQRTHHTELAKAIVHRHSNKYPYDGLSDSSATYKQLVTLCKGLPGVKLITAKEDLLAFEDIHLEAAQVVASNELFVRELLAWLRLNQTRRHDGMPGHIMGQSSLKTLLMRVSLGMQPGLFKKSLDKERLLLRHTPYVGIFCIKNETAKDFIKIGRLIELFWLKLTTLGLVGHPLTAAVANSHTRHELIKKFDLSDSPVFIMRVGAPTHKATNTPRRPA